VVADTVYNVPDTEIVALKDLYNATNGDFWYWSGGGNKWNFTDPNPCYDFWQGINCTDSPSGGFLHILEIWLDGHYLEGTIPESVVQLTLLSVLSVGSNAVYSPLPDTLGLLTELTVLYLGSNSLTGTIPDYLTQLRQLTNVDLSNNRLNGTIPSGIEQLTQLTTLYLDANNLTGTIPNSMGQLTLLTQLWLSNNELTGSIPDSIGQLAVLSGLGTDGNYLSGTIPDSVGQCSLLKELQLAHNHLSGSIPRSVQQLTLLMKVYLSFNGLSGTIPDVFQQLVQLWALVLNANKLTGPVPGTLATQSHLAFLDLSDNDLSGTIPETYQQLTVLDIVIFRANYMSGTVPDFLSSLTALRVLNLGYNHLRGSIPQGWTAGTVKILRLNENHLSGPVPESIGFLPLLASLNLSNNRLTGTIPVSFQRLTLLQVLMMHNNELTGNIVELFGSSQTNLSTVQLSGNQLTGILPAAAFLLPSLSSFAAVDNCFVGPLPEEAICSSTNLTSLVLDGLHSASSCKRSASLSHKAFQLGKLPLCLLSVPSLATLHLSGSGLTGNLPANVTVSAMLTDLSLSHNLLTGDIPESILGRDWNKLDLSYNRFTGTLHSASTAPYSDATQLHLEHNRLSGVIPSSVQHVVPLSLLENNMFSCRVDRSDVPQQDSDSDKFVCGSDAVNNSLYAWLGATVAVLTAAGVTASRNQNWLSISGWYAAAREAKFCDLQGLVGATNMLYGLGAGSAAYCILVLLPVYAAVNSYHPTFTYKYAWTVSGVLLTGTAAFAVEAVFLLLQLPVCLCMIEWLAWRNGFRPVTRAFTRAGAIPVSNMTSSRQHTVSNVAVMLLCLFVVTGVNVAFVIATLRLSGRVLTVIQVALAVFKLCFNTIISPALQYRVQQSGSDHDTTVQQVVWVLLNVVVIPCVVVMFISPACFYDALKGVDSVTSTYNFSGSCLNFWIVTDDSTGDMTAICAAVSTEVGTTTYKPPFTYSYQCSSSFVTYYAPTFVIMCIISGFVVPAYHLVLLWLRLYLSPNSSLYSIVTAATPRILRELQSPQDLAQARSDTLYRPVFDANKLMMSLLTYLALLLTFGALFPPLAVCCAVAMAMKALITRMQVGRYLGAATAADRQDCLDEVESACAGVATPQQLRMALYLVLAVSCLFYTLFLFDTLGYEVGFADAFWVLIVVPLLPGVAWVLYAALITGADKAAHDADPETGAQLAGLHQANAAGRGAVTAAALKPENAAAKTSDDAVSSITNPIHEP
jgi:Leucine-rich repeat (LRR) protein